jgi:hypothetical protein
MTDQPHQTIVDVIEEKVVETFEELRDHFRPVTVDPETGAVLEEGEAQPIPDHPLDRQAAKQAAIREQEVAATYGSRPAPVASEEPAPTEVVEVPAEPAPEAPAEPPADPTSPSDTPSSEPEGGPEAPAEAEEPVEEPVEPVEEPVNESPAAAEPVEEVAPSYPEFEKAKAEVLAVDPTGGLSETTTPTGGSSSGSEAGATESPSSASPTEEAPPPVE